MGEKCAVHDCYWIMVVDGFCSMNGDLLTS